MYDKTQKVTEIEQDGEKRARTDGLLTEVKIYDSQDDFEEKKENPS